MTKAKLATVFTVVILVSLGYCGLGGSQSRWAFVAAALFVLAFLGLIVVGFFSLFDWMSRRNQ